MTARQALAFVKRHGIVLQAARGPVPSLAAAVAGEPIRGSWWSHPNAREIFHILDVVCDDADVLVCTLVDGKVTLVHRRLWPALVRLSPSRVPKSRLARVANEHTATGAHRSRRIPLSKWLPRDVAAEAAAMSVEEALERTGLNFHRVAKVEIQPGSISAMSPPSGRGRPRAAARRDRTTSGRARSGAEGRRGRGPGSR
jgi:hypothetical protein